jgi:hypothetical protein
MRPNSYGWLLWVFLALAIAIPVWMFWPGGGHLHPLAAADRFELCPKIRATSEALVPRPDGFAGPNADEARTSTGFCRLHFPPQDRAGSRAEEPQLLVIVTSQRTFARGDLRARTDRFMEVNVKEMKVSGNAPEDIKGPWRTGVVVTRGGKAVDVHIEDDGVLMLIASSNIPRDSVVQFAMAAAKALRQRA